MRALYFPVLDQEKSNEYLYNSELPPIPFPISSMSTFHDFVRSIPNIKRLNKKSLSHRASTQGSAGRTGARKTAAERYTTHYASRTTVEVRPLFLCHMTEHQTHMVSSLFGLETSACDAARPADAPWVTNQFLLRVPFINPVIIALVSLDTRVTQHPFEEQITSVIACLHVP